MALLSLAACGGDGRGAFADGVEVRDSAGVTIVENRLPADGTAPIARRIAEVPRVEIGARDGPQELQFGSVGTAFRLLDERIVVVERTDTEGMIRFYHADGRFLRKVGRSGQGPGEFQLAPGAWPYRGDSIVAWDVGQMRLTVFDAEGETGRTASFTIPTDDPPAPSGMRAMALGGVTGILADSLLFVEPSRLMSVAGERVDYPHIYLRYSPEGEVLDTLGPFPQPAPGPSVSLYPGYVVRPFSPVRARVVHGDRILGGSGETYELHVYAMDGELERVVRLERPARPVTSEMREAFREAQLDRIEDPDTRRTASAALAGLEFPEVLPAYIGRLVVAEEGGGFWVPEYRLAEDEGPVRWDVFDAEGWFLGVARTPEGLRVFQIGEDFLLGEWRDELEVPYIRVYGLEREVDPGS